MIRDKKADSQCGYLPISSQKRKKKKKHFLKIRVKILSHRIKNAYEIFKNYFIWRQIIFSAFKMNREGGAHTGASWDSL